MINEVYKKIGVRILLASIFLYPHCSYCAGVNPKALVMKRGAAAAVQNGPASTAIQNGPSASDPQPPAVYAGAVQKTEQAHNEVQTQPRELFGGEDLVRVVNSLKVSSVKWKELSKRQLKEMVVYYFISEYKDSGVVINKPASYYVDLIDQMAAQNPQLLDGAFDLVLKVVAVIEYDFNNGQDKDLMARRILGEEGFLKNKERLGIK